MREGTSTDATLLATGEPDNPNADGSDRPASLTPRA
jgi:hypothetical protein